MRLKCRVFGVKTGPIATVRVFVWQDPLQRFGSGSEPDPEPTREFGTVANTSQTYGWQTTLTTGWDQLHLTASENWQGSNGAIKCVFVWRTHR